MMMCKRTGPVGPCSVGRGGIVSTVKLFGIVAVLLASAAIPCGAQADSTRGVLVPGAKVRLGWSSPDAGQNVGRAIEVRSGGFLFQPDDGDGVDHVAFTSLSSLEVSTGSESNWAKGLFLGLIGGAVTGYAIASRDHEVYDIDPRPFGAVLFGVGGGLVGAIIGTQVKSDRWVTVPLPP